ncbi:MAG: hypothetical protein JW973_11435 [Bacteroidales bacterium]|nr:hypothetical protein [Bacteroidales bacterium]
MFYAVKTLAGIFSLLLISIGTIGSAQFRDGTETTHEWIEEIRKNLDAEKDLVYNEASVYHTTHLLIAAFIVNDPAGMANCNEGDLAAGISSLNAYFNTINVNFILHTVQYVKEYSYGFIHDEGTVSELVKKYSMDRTINLFLVESIETDTAVYYGFTYFPDDTIRNYIFINKYLIRGNYIITLMGHFFGLLSTHDTLGGTELVNQKNCTLSGDFLCDTWADPNLFERVDTACVYIDDPVDPNGAYYVPSVANLMSESYDKCKCIFTPHQYRRMLFCLKNYRYYLR